MDHDPNVIVEAPNRPEGSPLAQVKHIIAVGSGKGGVGKSTTTVNLAVALQKLGAKVGILDADIYGPSVPHILGSRQSPTRREGEKIQPSEKDGIKFMSMALLGGDAPAVWRGPMASRAIHQFLGEVEWGELDYLLIDLPPGTGDIQITISQAARLSGAVVVMTPQLLATDVAKRGLKMFQQVRLPVLGLVENMSRYVCSSCQKETHLFQQGGARTLSKDFHLPVLAEIPFDPELLANCDSGKPILSEKPESEVAQSYVQLAKNMATELRNIVEGKREIPPQIVNIEPNSKAKIAKVIWNDGKTSLVTYKDLRFICPCAVCVDEGTGERKIKKEDIKDDVAPLRVETIGNYAIKIHWSDEHNTGIYSYDYLRRHLVKES